MNQLSHLLVVFIMVIILIAIQNMAAAIYDAPVCGADHRTYSDADAALRAGVDSIPGKCLEPAKSCGCGK